VDTDPEFITTVSLSAEEEDLLQHPILLDDVEVTAMSAECFTGWFGDMVKAVSKSTETPIELPAMLGLSVLATACQKKFVISPEPGYQEPLNLWTVVALQSGNRKSAVLDLMALPLLDWEMEEYGQISPEIKKSETERKNQEARINFLRSKYAKADPSELDELEKEICQLEEALPEIPSIPRLWAQDITPEKLGQIMAEHEEKISILSDEGGIFDILAGRYNAGIPNLDIFLQAHAGTPVRVDRSSRKSVRLEAPALTLGLSPQPDVLRSLADKPGFRGRGLLARFLYALPKSLLGSRQLNNEPITENIIEAYSDGIFALLNLDAPFNEYGDIQPFVLRLDESAYREWKEFQRSVEKNMRKGEKFEYITDWAGKLPGAVLRIAGLLHCAEHTNCQPETLMINKQSIEQALNLAAILSEHALAAFNLIGADPSLDAARKVWDWIEQNRLEIFTARDCFASLKGTFKKMAAINPGFNVLLERNYIFEQSPKETVGRPSRLYGVNPILSEKWK